MIGAEDNVVQFLLGLGVLDAEDAEKIKEAQVEPIISVLLEKQALSPLRVEDARGLLKKIISTSNHLKRMKHQMAFMHLVTGRMHERMEASSQKIRDHRQRVTSGSYVAVGGMVKVASD